MSLLGAILAGGASRRFGSDKALAELGGVPLIEHVRRAIAPQVDALIVVGRAWPGLPDVPDRPRSGLGPLGGLAGALHHAQAMAFAQVLTVPCDAPRLPPALAALLAANGAPAAIAECPVIGLWPASLAGALDAHLAVDGDRSMRGWLKVCNGRLASVGAPISNVNRPADLRALTLD